MSHSSLFEQLYLGLKALKLPQDESLQEKMIQFLLFLQKWNQHYNLTAITDLKDMINLHLLDSLSIALYITGDNILDVGTGGGFPGIPLALYFPQKKWVLLDSNGKKTRFLVQAKAELKLENIEIIHTRVENWQTDQKFHTIVTRAVGNINELLDKTQHLSASLCRWLFMKGIYPADELSTLQKKVTVYPLSVPGLLAQRHLVMVA